MSRAKPKDVGGLQVAVHDAARVDRVERLRDLRCDAQRRARGKALSDARGEGAGGQELHGDVRIVAAEALVVDARHVVHVEARHQLVLAHEALEEDRVVAQRAVQDFQSNAQPVVLALGEEHLRLPALADDVHDVVARDRLLARHWRNFAISPWYDQYGEITHRT
jgi:hypothetical protein